MSTMFVWSRGCGTTTITTATTTTTTTTTILLLWVLCCVIRWLWWLARSQLALFVCSMVQWWCTLVVVIRSQSPGGVFTSHSMTCRLRRVSGKSPPSVGACAVAARCCCSTVSAACCMSGTVPSLRATHNGLSWTRPTPLYAGCSTWPWSSLTEPNLTLSLTLSLHPNPSQLDSSQLVAAGSDT